MAPSSRLESISVGRHVSRNLKPPSCHINNQEQPTVPDLVSKKFKKGKVDTAKKIIRKDP